MFKDTPDRLPLRTMFDQVALDYDAARPGYPQALIEDVIALSGIPDGGRILEVGCGTGQATLPFAQRGYTMTCLDIGAEMIAVARQKLRDYPNVSFQVAAFEEWGEGTGNRDRGSGVRGQGSEVRDQSMELPQHPTSNIQHLKSEGVEGQGNIGELFDLLISAMAFHWVPEEVRYVRSAAVLKQGGALAIFSNEHPRPYSGFFIDNQVAYDTVVPEWSDPDEKLSADESIRLTAERIDATGLFEPVIVRTYPWSQVYTVDEYIRLLNTYSDHRSLETSRRQRLFDGLAEIMNTKYGGRVTKPYLAVLYMAKLRGEQVSG